MKAFSGEEGPVAVRTTLGWILSGPAKIVRPQEPIMSLVATHALRVDDGVTNSMLDTTLKSFWDLESMGIGPEATEDKVADHFASSVRLRDNRYEVSLPWREQQHPLPTNYSLSRRRLTGLLHRLRQSPEILQEYDSIIRTQLQSGIVEEVKDGDAGPVHYLPHHAVVCQDKDTTKVRIVFDASSKSTGPSLNDCLHVGPKFNQKINEILFRFRSYTVALVADIEKAFLMISVSPADRDVLRFLWVEDPFGDEVKLVNLRFTRVVFGVSSSPFLLNATMRHHLQLYQASKPRLVEMLARSTYVDDIVAGADTESEAYQLYLDAKEVLISFNLRKFVSNSPYLQKQIDEKEATVPNEQPPSIGPAEETFSEVTIPTDSLSRPGERKVLGVRWRVEDQLVFDLTHLAEKAAKLQPTKSNVVSVGGQIYDPLGYLAPVTITFKILMQEVCRIRFGWDQPLTGEPLLKWSYNRASHCHCPDTTLVGYVYVRIVRCSFKASVMQHMLLLCIWLRPLMVEGPPVLSSLRHEYLHRPSPRLELMSALLATVTITFKILMQEVCRIRFGWDQPLTGEPLLKWSSLVKALQSSKPLSLPRHYFGGICVRSHCEVQLQGFCDASNAAYAAVVYLVKTTYGRRATSFVVSKTRVSPLKTQTIPRLELMSALLLARLITNVAESLAPRYDLLPHVCFTDSQVALF